MNDRSPRQHMSQRPVRSLKEKRADKQAKRTEKAESTVIVASRRQRGA